MTPVSYLHTLVSYTRVPGAHMTRLIHCAGGGGGGERLLSYLCSVTMSSGQRSMSQCHKSVWCVPLWTSEANIALGCMGYLVPGVHQMEKTNELTRHIFSYCSQMFLPASVVSVSFLPFSVSGRTMMHDAVTMRAFPNVTCRPRSALWY